MSTAGLVSGWTGVATAALLAAIGLGFASAPTPTMAAAPVSEIARLAAAGGLPAIEAMLDLRSPGYRLPGALTQTKPRRIATLKEYFGPKERVLGKERTRPVVPARTVPDQPDTVETVDYVTPNLPLVPGSGVGTGTPPGDVLTGGTQPATFGGGFLPGSGGGTLIFGGGGGSTSSGGGDTSVVTTAVPEPATWLTLIFGFLAIGFTVRHRPAVAPARFGLS